MLAREVRAVPFALQAGGATAEVVVGENEPVEAALRTDRKLVSDALNRPTPEMEAFLARHSVQSRRLLLRRSLRYHEAIVEEHETVVVAGLAQRRVEHPAFAVEGGDNAPTERWSLTGGPAGPLLVCDEPLVVRAQADEHNRRFTEHGGGSGAPPN